jgi:hypothetical protein
MTHFWHRSPAFWLGLAPLLFLFWAWFDSMHHHSGIQREMTMTSDLFGAEPNDSIEHHDARISLILAEPVSPENYTIAHGPLESFRAPLRGHEWFPAPSHRSETVQDMVIFHERSIPHWLIILAYLLLWSLAFYCRHRRIQRHLTKHPSLPPAQPQADL